jgi:ribosomal protein S18 acetylase RimI-like enzyme
LTEVEYRRIRSDDRAALQAFADRIPAGDRSFFDRVLLHQVAVAGWTMAVPARRSVAVDGADIVGIVTVVPGAGWTRHVGELRAIVQPDRRGEGVGQALVRIGLDLARELELEKVTVEVMASNSGAIAMFEALGFRQEARLVGQVRDGANELQDLLILSLRIDAAVTGRV